jgi:ABC-2 type transport system permease protein
MYFLLLLFSGANIPRSDMPQWMLMVSDFLPLTRAIQASREIAAGADFADISNLLGMELLVGIIYACLGFMIFRWVEFQARVYGTIDQM